MDELMNDLGVSSYDELLDYIHDPVHQDEDVVKELLVIIALNE